MNLKKNPLLTTRRRFFVKPALKNSTVWPEHISFGALAANTVNSSNQVCAGALPIVLCGARIANKLVEYHQRVLLLCGTSNKTNNIHPFGYERAVLLVDYLSILIFGIGWRHFLLKTCIFIRTICYWKTHRLELCITLWHCHRCIV